MHSVEKRYRNARDEDVCFSFFDFIYLVQLLLNSWSLLALILIKKQYSLAEIQQC